MLVSFVAKKIFPLDSNPSKPLPPRSPLRRNATTDALVFGMLAAAAKPLSSKILQLNYDLVDSGRQFLDNLLWDLARLLSAAFHRRDVNATVKLSLAWKQAASDLNTILGTDTRFMLGPWIEVARNAAASPDEQDLMEYNARNQITFWGPKRNGLSDYARKQWHGLVESYHVQGRWGIPIEYALKSMHSASPYDAAGAAAAVTQHENAWQTNYSQHFPSVPVADTIAVTNDIVDRYLTPSGYILLKDQDTKGAASGNDKFSYVAQPSWTKNTASLAFLCSKPIPLAPRFAWSLQNRKSKFC